MAVASAGDKILFAGGLLSNCIGLGVRSKVDNLMPTNTWSTARIKCGA
jgi:hypothetical protein